MTLTVALTLRDCEQVSDLTLFAYPDADHAEDKRVAYANAKYPHLEAVHMFKAIKPTDEKAGFPKQFDTSRISIPARGGAGMYIVQYFWRGYRDCIDVEVLPDSTPVARLGSMYGIGPQPMAAAVAAAVAAAAVGERWAAARARPRCPRSTTASTCRAATRCHLTLHDPP